MAIYFVVLFKSNKLFLLLWIASCACAINRALWYHTTGPWIRTQATNTRCIHTTNLVNSESLFDVNNASSRSGTKIIVPRRDVECERERERYYLLSWTTHINKQLFVEMIPSIELRFYVEFNSTSIEPVFGWKSGYFPAQNFVPLAYFWSFFYCYCCLFVEEAKKTCG